MFKHDYDICYGHVLCHMLWTYICLPNLAKFKASFWVCGFDAPGVVCGELLAVGKNQLSLLLHGWTLHCSVYTSLLSSTPVPICPAFNSSSPVFRVAMHLSFFYLDFYHCHPWTGSSIFGIWQEGTKMWDHKTNISMGLWMRRWWWEMSVLYRVNKRHCLDEWSMRVGPIEQWG